MRPAQPVRVELKTSAGESVFAGDRAVKWAVSIRPVAQSPQHWWQESLAIKMSGNLEIEF